MTWKLFVNDQAKRAFDELRVSYATGIENFNLDVRDRAFRELRNELLGIEREARSAAAGKRNAAYVFDLEFALRMYAGLDKLGFGLWQAADNGVWAYLGIRVIPDILFRRLSGFNEERFYKRNWRIWLKDLWWYVYITESDAAEEFDIEETRQFLANDSQDIMFLLLDHSKGGFRPSVYHALMKQYAEIISSGKLTSDREAFFRRLLLEHQIKSAVVDPILQTESVYVKSLIDSVLPKFTKENV